MSAPQLMLICFAVVVCIGPLSIYICWLAAVNRRPNPSAIPGLWDFARLYAALSGFILVGGVFLLALVQGDGRFLGQGDWATLAESWGQERAHWLFTVTGYLLMVIGGGFLVAANRTRSLAVYNVNAAEAERLVQESLDAAGIPAVRQGSRWVVRVGERWQEELPLVELVAFCGSAHASIHFLGENAATRAELERTLRPALESLSAPGQNPAIPWLTSLASGTVVVLVGFVLLGVYVTLTR